MNYAKIKHYDIANGEGVRMSLFVSGCQFHCGECFNKETWDYRYGEEYTEDTEKELLQLINNPNIDGLSILGGDPLWQDESGLISLIALCHKVHDLGKTVWLWSGFKWETLVENQYQSANAMLRYALVKNQVDVFVDGQFDINKKDLTLKWRGSSNQRVIDVKETIKNKHIVLKE